MDKELLIKLLIALAAFLFTTLIPSVVGFIKNRQKAKNAKNEAEKQAAINELKELAREFVVDAENLWKNVDPILKSNGISFGATKKESVMTKLLRACIDKNVDFDEAYWSKEVDDLVTVTRQVNAK